MMGMGRGDGRDVQIIHAIAPDAGIVVMTEPLAETEDTVGRHRSMQLGTI